MQVMLMKLTCVARKHRLSQSPLPNANRSAELLYIWTFDNIVFNRTTVLDASSQQALAAGVAAVVAEDVVVPAFAPAAFALAAICASVWWASRVSSSIDRAHFAPAAFAAAACF
jgi:hypothetical protein